MPSEPGFEDPLAPKRPARVTGARVPPVERKRIWRLHLDGWNYGQIARQTGFDRRQVSAICKGLQSSEGRQWAAAREVEDQPDPRSFGELCPEAKRALEDFGYFRARYFGRVSTPWQEAAGYRVLELLEEPEKTFAVINAPPSSGKALCLDTPLLTPSGWTTMKDIQPGDRVFDERGLPCRVVAKSEVFYGRHCYEVRADDGASVVADAGHEWVVRLDNNHARPDRPGKTGPRPQWGDGRTTHTTEDLARVRSKRPKLQLAESLRFRRRRLPIEPWLLGYWLGNGQASAGAVTSGGLREDQDAAYVVGRIGPTARVVRQDLATHQAYIWVRGLSGALRREGLLRNKYVPDAYLQASPEQRLALLQGLVDSDGYVSEGGEVEFCSTNRRLAEGVRFLVRSLGAKASLAEGRAVLEGKDCGPKWRVHFMLEGAAGLPRKACRTRDAERTPERYLTVTPVESVPTQCLQVDSPSGLFLAGEGLLVTHNSTLFTHDLPCWLACRNRRLRALIGSRTYRQARWYTARLRRTFERFEVLPPDDEEVVAGRALVPQASLVGDFGRFRPITRFSQDLWRAEEFVIAQPGDVTISEKEASFAAFGFDSGYLGGRYRFIVWDDLVDRRNMRTAEAREALIEQYEDVAETRLEMGGLLLLQGQRLGSDDLYRHALDQTAGNWDEDEDDDVALPKKYRHVVYKAHYDEACRGKETHGRNAPYWRPPASPPGEVLRGLFGYTAPQSGCLLDPRRITWRELRQIRANRGQKFHTLYQQEDVDPEDVLVPRLWVDGGTDPATGELFPGCWDKGRVAGQPPKGLVAPVHSYVTVDPSPTMYWSTQWWLWHPASEQRFLIDLARRRMAAPEFLDWNHLTGEFSGLAEEWQLRSEDTGCRITHWIVEANAAQRFLLQYDHVRRWMALRRASIVPHQCVDTATEVLSQRGWLKSAEVEVGDLILTLNVATGRSEWQPVQFVYRGLHDGEMLRIASRNLDALCTLDHRWAVGQQHDRRLRFVESQGLNSNHLVPLARPLAPDQEPEPAYSDDLVELVAWAVTEGHFRHQSPRDTGIAIGQSERVNGPNVLRIRSLLKRMGAHWREEPPRPNGVVVMTVSGPVAQAVRRITQDRIYIPPGFVAALTVEQRALLLEVFALADGWTHGRTTSFCSNDEPLIVAYEMASALNGRPTYRTTRTDRPQHKVVRNKQASDAYLGNPGVRPIVVDFTGEIWCPSTVNGTFYARRGGVTYFTGNTQRNKTDPDFGIQSIAPLYRHGLVRLPTGGNHHGDTSRIAALALVDEVTRYPDCATDDCAVAQWIGEYNLPRLFPRRPERVVRQQRPSWLAPNVRALPSAWTGRAREAG